ncbi:hypothetical protein EI94DRAFT_1897977 [Lactarius quietus]|nr:hypothetical protein EI94DRAFT_1897977 [Lactarius quietus]
MPSMQITRTCHGALDLIFGWLAGCGSENDEEKKSDVRTAMSRLLCEINMVGITTLAVPTLVLPTFAPRITGKPRICPGPCFLTLSLLRSLIDLCCGWRYISQITGMGNNSSQGGIRGRRRHHLRQRLASVGSLYGDGDNNTHAPHPLCVSNTNLSALYTLWVEGNDVIVPADTTTVGWGTCAAEYCIQMYSIDRNCSRASLTSSNPEGEKSLAEPFKGCPHVHRAGLLHQKGGDPVVISVTLAEKVASLRTTNRTDPVQDPPTCARLLVQKGEDYGLGGFPPPQNLPRASAKQK